MRSDPPPPHPSPASGGGSRPSLWYAALIIMTVVIIMIVIMPMTMAVPVIIGLMLVMMNSLGRTAPPRILAEQQRLDRDRHGERWHPNAPEIDIIEVSQHNSVDGQDFALDQELLAQNSAEGLRDITIKHDEDRLPALDGRRPADRLAPMRASARERR